MKEKDRLDTRTYSRRNCCRNHSFIRVCSHTIGKEMHSELWIAWWFIDAHISSLPHNCWKVKVGILILWVDIQSDLIYICSHRTEMLGFLEYGRTFSLPKQIWSFLIKNHGHFKLGLSLSISSNYYFFHFSNTKRVAYLLKMDASIKIKTDIWIILA